jgi:GR25 family glycosyltransferase involved in LPS biosynthesis
MNKISKVYYINLDRRPDRNEHFLKQCSLIKINYEKICRYKAIDGNTYEFSQEEKDMFKNSDFRTQSYSKKIMGNQLSHFNILKEMVLNNYKYILVFQDDVIFRDDFIYQIDNLIDYIPSNAEIINIGYHKFGSYSKFIPYDVKNKEKDLNMSKKDINDYVCLLNDTINPCSLGYIVTFNGAKNLIQHFKNIGFLRATDWNFNDYLRSKNIFYGSKEILCTGNPDLGSDIFI